VEAITPSPATRRDAVGEPRAGREGVERGRDRGAGHGGERPEAAAGHADHRTRDRRRHPQGGEHRAVAPDGDQQRAVAGVAVRGDVRAVGDARELDEVHAALGRPVAQGPQRARHVAPRMHDDADARDALAVGARHRDDATPSPRPARRAAGV
jgi:hypothetical protein